MGLPHRVHTGVQAKSCTQWSKSCTKQRADIVEQNQKSVPHRGAKAVPHTEHTLGCRGGRRERHQMTRSTAPSKPTLHRTVACILHSLELCQTEFLGKIVNGALYPCHGRTLGTIAQPLFNEYEVQNLVSKTKTSTL